MCSVSSKSSSVKIKILSPTSELKLIFDSALLCGLPKKHHTIFYVLTLNDFCLVCVYVLLLVFHFLNLIKSV